MAPQSYLTHNFAESSYRYHFWYRGVSLKISAGITWTVQSLKGNRRFISFILWYIISVFVRGYFKIIEFHILVIKYAEDQLYSYIIIVMLNIVESFFVDDVLIYFLAHLIEFKFF